MKKQTLIQAIFFFVSFMMCTFSYSQNDAQQTTALKVGMARIYFTRHAGLMGAAVVHAVADKGDNSNFNSYLAEKKTFPSDKYNFDVAANVQMLYVRMNDKESKLAIGKPQKSDVSVKSKFDVASYPELAAIPGPLKSFLALDPFYFVNSEPLTYNARIVGAVGSGDTFYWDRPAGTLKLVDITPGGDEAFAQPFEVVAGKSYTVDYYYMKAKFDIIEKK